MKLSKFFRRYSRALLMVFMSLLLVVFLLGDVLQNVGRNWANPKWKLGTAFQGADIFTTEFNTSQAKQELLGLMGFQQARYLDAMEFYLLTEEARRLGIRIGHEQVKQILTQIFGAQQAEERLSFLQQRYRRSYASMYDVAGEWLAVGELMALQAEALDQSLPRAALAFRNQRQNADVQLAIVDAQALVDQVPEPSEQELQAFFEQGKDRETAHTEDELKFGYALPDRVRVEYLTVDPRQIEPKVRVRERDAQLYYEEHKQNYVRTIPAPPDTQPTGVAKPPTPVQMTYEEARERVRQDARIDKAIKEAQVLVHQLRDAAYQRWQMQPHDEAGFRKAPPAEDIVSFEALRDSIMQRGEQYEVTYGKTELLGRADLARQFETLPDMARRLAGWTEPVYREGQTSLTLSQLALRAQGLFTPDKNDTSPVLNLFEPSPVVIAQERPIGGREQRPYQAFVFRVIETAPKGPPAALDEVRERVAKDYKLFKAYELAGTYARKLEQRAREVGLTAAVQEAVELKELMRQADEKSKPILPPAPNAPPPTDYLEDLGPYTPVSFTRDSRSIYRVGTTQKLPREVLALATVGNPDTAPAHKVTAVGIANLTKWVVAELMGVAALYEGEFEQQRTALLSQGRATDQQMLQWGWISPDNVRQRTGYVPAAGVAEPRE